jgi:hypothetical protein
MSAFLEEAHRDLVRGGLIASLGSLEPDGKLGGFSFRCELPAPFPNPEGLPALVPVKVRVPPQFPLAKVEFVLTDRSMWGFAHQDGLTGAICLRREDQYPFDPSGRLLAYAEGAIDWVEHAASGTLLQPGERWELPDFRVERPDRPPGTLPIEDASTFGAWDGRVGQHGLVHLTAHVHRAGLVPTRFERRGELVVQANVSEGFLDRQGSIIGGWLLLPSHIFARHRPAKTFAELEGQCQAVGIDLWSILHHATKTGPYKGYHYVLVGAPIPERVGDRPTAVHWQPLAIPSSDMKRFGGSKRRGFSRPERTRRARLQGTLALQALPWTTSVTYPESRSQARGSLVEPVKKARICLLGCGALGSPIGEYLARGGARNLSYFDSEPVELENTSRHELGPQDVGKGKALALAERVKGIHPGADVRGFLFTLPPPRVPTRGDRLAWTLLDQADVLIDCTTSKPAFLWASRVGRQAGKLVIHMFLNARARMLTICISGQHISCDGVAQELFRDILEGRAGFGIAEYDGDETRVELGAGCWSATFPALGSDIAALAAVAMPIVEDAIRRGRSSRGSAFVLRRNELDRTQQSLMDTVPQCLVEVAWKKEYR